MGYMKGYYTLVKLPDGKEFQVDIPRFDLLVPGKLN
jgi:uncharacterized protein affecting Mg2+/Co2+ transport